MTRAPSSGKVPRRAGHLGKWTSDVIGLCILVDIGCTTEDRTKQVILRLRERDAEGAPGGGTAVLTLYATGSWTWGGDADAVAYARVPLEAHELL